MTGKEKVINYCNRMLEEISVEHLEACQEVRDLLKCEDNDYLTDYCPSSYGLDNYKGLCEINNESDKLLIYDEQVDQCKKCWEIALI